MRNDERVSFTAAWPHDPWALSPYRRGQVLLRRREARAVRVLDLDPLTGCYLLDDGTWALERELADPLLEGRRRDVARGQADAIRRAAVARGDFAAAFPDLGRPAPEVPPAPPPIVTYAPFAPAPSATHLGRAFNRTFDWGRRDLGRTLVLALALEGALCALWVVLGR